MSFFTIKYGDNLERLFNCNCINTVLLGHIKTALELDFPEQIDLFTDAGDMLDLHSKPKEYAKKYIEPRMVCTLVKIVKDEDGGPTRFVPLSDSAVPADRTLKLPNAAGRRMTKKHIQMPAHLSSAGANNPSTAAAAASAAVAPTKEPSTAATTVGSNPSPSSEGPAPSSSGWLRGPGASSAAVGTRTTSPAIAVTDSVGDSIGMLGGGSVSNDASNSIGSGGGGMVAAAAAGSGSSTGAGGADGRKRSVSIRSAAASNAAAAAKGSVKGGRASAAASK
ncbi:hypothetical protein BC828DRAFT_26333 [Blastocladiella britannica]|nr:hypothetical protein BC828DRAFT_26333 [Blastocladiella britannica]